MAKALVGALALASLPSALAFRNTSPLFFFSTAPLTPTDFEIATADKVQENLKDALSGCPSRTYVLVQQNGVSSTDYVDDNAAPRLASYMKSEHAQIQSTATVGDVVGRFDLESLSKHIQSKCGAERVSIDIANGEGVPEAQQKGINAAPQVIEVKLPAHRASERGRKMTRYDRLLEHILQTFASSSDYTVVYTTVSRDEASKAEHAYEIETAFNDAVHMEMKRDNSLHARAEREGGLFEKYQYFSPGLFMAFLVIIPFLFILGVGLRALSSLEVSYFAFSKEMGPTAQKKQ